MELSPERKQSIKDSLSMFMNEAEAEQFLNLSYAIDLIKRGQLCWQALVSIGVHAAELGAHAETNAEKAILQDFVGQALEPLEALIESLVLEVGEEPRESERSRMLFHARFALGFLLLAIGEKQRSKAILHEMAATKLSVRGIEVSSGPGIVSYTPDMAMGKWKGALYLLSEYGPREDYGELLYIITEAAACNSWDTVMVNLAPAVLDRWAAECDQEDATKAFDFPTPEWLDLFTEAAEILSVCQEVDSEGTLPSECKPESAQFLAWKFGQIVGRFATPDNRWHDCAFDNLWKLSGAFRVEDFYFQREQQKTYQALKVVLSLLCEHDSSRDSNAVRKRYVSMWKSSYSYRGISLDDISPSSDLYWAMRIGFVDKMLETTEQRALIQFETVPLIRDRDIEVTKDIVSNVALRQIMQQQSLDRILERLPPRKREIQQRLQRSIGPVWAKLPAKVVNTLVKAEEYYSSEVNDDDAKVWFNKAVEASLYCCLVEPLVNFTQKQDDRQIAVCFPPPRGVERKSSSMLRKLSLREWSEVLETLAVPPGKSLASLGTGDLRLFMEEHLGGPRLPDFSPLAESLLMIHRFRAGSAHYEAAISRYEKEKGELEQMRNLVLGIGRPSVITQIFQLVGAKGIG